MEYKQINQRLFPEGNRLVGILLNTKRMLQCSNLKISACGDTHDLKQMVRNLAELSSIRTPAQELVNAAENEAADILTELKKETLYLCTDQYRRRPPRKLPPISSDK